MKRLLAAVFAVGLLSACAGVAAPGAAKSETPQQSLSDTGKAMGQVKSVKFDLNGTVNVTLPQALVDQLKAKAGSRAAILSSNMTVGLKASGTVNRPDQLQATIEASLNDGALKIDTEVIATGGNLYYKDPMTGSWKMVKRPATASASKAENGTGSKAGASKLSYQTVLDTAKSVTEVSGGSSTMDGTTVEHYQVVPDLAKLFNQVSAGHASNNSAAMAALQTILQNANVVADFWTGTSDHLVRRFSYDATVSADLHQLAAAIPQGSSARANAPALNLPAGSMAQVTAHIVIDLHDFNSKVTIKAPAVSG